MFKKLRQKLTAPLEKSKQKKLDAIFDLYQIEDIQEPVKTTKKVKIFIPELNDYKEVTVESNREIVKTPKELDEIIRRVEKETKQDTIKVEGKNMKKVNIYIPEFNEYKEVLIESERQVLSSPEKFRDVLSDISAETKDTTKDENIVVNGKNMKRVYIYIPEFNEYKQVLVDADRPIPMSRYSLQQLTKKFSDIKNTNVNLYNDIYKTIDRLYASIMLDESFPIGEDITKRTYSLYSDGNEYGNEYGNEQNYDYINSPSEFQPDLPELNDSAVKWNNGNNSEKFFEESDNESDILDVYLNENKNHQQDHINKYQFLDLYSENGSDEQNEDKEEEDNEEDEIEQKQDGKMDGKDKLEDYKVLDDYMEEYKEEKDNPRSYTEDIVFSTLVKGNNKRRKSLSRYYD